MTPIVATAHAALDDLRSRRGFSRLGVAVSGGGDSMALLDLILGWAGGRDVEVRAATVDHRLRAASAAEACHVADFAASRGVPHDVLAWEDERDGGNLQAAARAARRRLMAGWAGERGLRDVALGHTLDDQAETLLLRLARGSGVDGLSAMRSLSCDGTLGWLRPLLGTRRADLRDHLRAEGIGWIEDPSNEDPAFDRVRARAALAALEPVGIDAAGLAATADRLEMARDALERLAQMAARATVRFEEGDAVFDRAELDRWPEETRLRLLAHAVRWVAGPAYRPRLASLRRAAVAAVPTTLAGALFIPRSGDLRITREARAAAGSAAPGEVWDGRWRVTGPARPMDAVRALGTAVDRCPDRRASPLPRASLTAGPAVWRAGNSLPRHSPVSAPAGVPIWCATRPISIQP